MPNNIEDYIHQVGRAGRLFIQGAAMLFINKSNKNMFVSLHTLCQKSGSKLPEELLASPFMHDALAKERKVAADRAKISKKRKLEDGGDNDDVTRKSLLDILRKNK